MLFRVFVLATCVSGLASWAGCGGCGGGGFDAGVPDTPPPGGSFSLAWSVIDQTTGLPVSCDKLDPNATVVVEAHRQGTGAVESFACKSLQGSSTASLAPDTYSFSFELHATIAGRSVAIATAVSQVGVVVGAGQQVPLAPIRFDVNATGRLDLKLRAGSAGNCVGGAGITGFAISLEHAGGVGDSGCAPVVFTLSGGGTYDANDCSSPPVTRCISADETLSVVSLASGPYQIHVRGKVGTVDCWTNDDALRVPPSGAALSQTLNLALQSATPGCQ